MKRSSESRSSVARSQATPRVRTIRKAAELIGIDQWKRWVFLVFLAVVLSGLEMVGAILVYVLIGLVSDPAGAIELPAVGDVRPLAGDLDHRSLLIVMILILATFFLARAALRVATVYAQARAAHNAGARLSNTLVAGYLRAPYPFHLQRSSPELIRNSYQATQHLVSQVFLPLIRIGADSILALGLLIAMVLVAPTATAIAVVVIGTAAGVLLLVVQPRLKRLGHVAHSTSEETLGLLQQALHGIRDIKVLGREHWFEKAYAKARLRMARAFYLRVTLSELPSSMTELSLIGFILIFFAAGVVSGPDNAPSALPVLAFFGYVGLRLRPSVQNIIKGLNDLKFSTAPLDDLHADLLTIKQIHRPPTSVTPFPFQEFIEMENVSFRHQGTHTDTLRHIQLKVHSGETIGICGPTGGGKSTLVDVLTGLLQPTKGSVTVDGVDIQTDVRAWQQNLGVVSQMVFLLNDTLRRNIAIGLSDNDIDDTALQEALDLAQLRDFVRSLPDGLNTVIGERGTRISGGQRQRIAIARALYQRPKVLIFDEATSALDNATEAALMNSIDSLRDEHTILLVAHRLSTVRSSDRIIFIENGQITGDGSFSELSLHHDSFRIMANGII